MKLRYSALAAMIYAMPTVAGAQSTTPASLPDTAAPALCTDRPTKSNAVCTVPAGMIQIESDLPNWTRNTDAGTRTDVLLYANPYVKLGLGPDTDVEANIAPYVDIRTHTGSTVDHARGVGDLYIRLKQRFTDPSRPLQVGIIPFVKAPVAKRGIGNREWEGGVALPVQYSLSGGWTLTTGPELDVLADGDGSGKHVQLVATANVAKALSPKLTAYAELWTAQNYDPAGTSRQYSADLAVAYLLTPTVQLDLGGNFGLNRTTPDAQITFGVSTRF